MNPATPYCLTSMLKATLEISDGVTQNLALPGCVQDSQINEFTPADQYTLAPSASNTVVNIGRMSQVKYLILTSDAPFSVSVDDDTHYTIHGQLAVITGTHTAVYLSNPSSTAVVNVKILMAGNR